MNELLRNLVSESNLDIYGLGMSKDKFEHIVEKFAKLIVQECIQQLEIGKKCDPYKGELFTCEHNDNIDYQIEVLKEHFEPVHASDTSSERVNKTAKNEHEWVGLTKEEVDSWELPDYPTVFEFVQFIEAKVKEKNYG
jgi:hypothetical protein